MNANQFQLSVIIYEKNLSQDQFRLEGNYSPVFSLGHYSSLLNTELLIEETTPRQEYLFNYDSNIIGHLKSNLQTDNVLEISYEPKYPLEIFYAYDDLRQAFYIMSLEDYLNDSYCSHLYIYIFPKITSQEQQEIVKRNYLNGDYDPYVASLICMVNKPFIIDNK